MKKINPKILGIVFMALSVVISIIFGAVLGVAPPTGTGENGDPQLGGG